MYAWLLWQQQPYQWRKSKTKEKPCGQGLGQWQDLHQKQNVPSQYSFALYIVIACINIGKVSGSSRDNLGRNIERIAKYSSDFLGTKTATIILP